MKHKYFILLLLFWATACSTTSENTLAQAAAIEPDVTLSSVIQVAEAVEIPNAVIDYYDIFGSTETELRNQLDTLGPLGYDGYKGDSTTNWFIHWNWPGYGDSTCDLNAVTVSYEIQVKFPRWDPPAHVNPELATKWAEYSRKLAKHEKGHVDYVVENYQSVAEAIKTSTCDTAEIAAQTALALIRQHDIDYDAETIHGASQGARFP